MEYILSFKIIKNNKEIGKIFVNHCPDLNLAEELLDFGGNGHKFFQIAEAVYDEIDSIEYITASASYSIIPVNYNNVCIVPWKSAYGN